MTTLAKLMAIAQLTLDDPSATQEALQVAYDDLNVWHRANHGGPRNSILCTGCRVYPLLEDLRYDLLTYIPGVVRPVGAERHKARRRLLDAVLGKKREVSQ